MIEQQGRVVRAEAGAAWVSVGARSGCAACDAGRGCGAGLFGRLLRRDPVEMRLDASRDYRAGQAVRVGVAEGVFLRLVMRLYGWPLLAGLVGGWFGSVVAGRLQLSAGWADSLALIGLAAGAGLVLIGSRGLDRGRWLRGEVTLLEEVPGDFCPGREYRRADDGG